MPCIGGAGIQCSNWDLNHAVCIRCGWEYNEAKRRKNIVLTPSAKGLQSKKVKK